ncbi:acyl-CoA thioesterase [Streptomyces sp. PTM05]|uniref:Acyl-CoA thioesterase n=1 Tax=Streptantibioticus parmotrematis TaxID=2873249 RepID=A0ABS7QTJ4_9ACTN|nr:thioesterase family protein [Streptantibioticus parmotrematis]MBY8886507.1 acyl-CoA thioesterase [Streptantibioticus parmotrematis]
MARHIYRCPLRWSDMDAFGHVNNAVFLRYLEEARIDLTFRRAPGEGRGSFSGGSVVARHEIDYLRPLVHSYEPVTVETWVTRMTAASVTYAYEIKDAEQVYVRARTVVVPYDLTEGRPRRLTPEEREFLEGYRDDGAEGPDSGERAPEEAVAV